MTALVPRRGVLGTEYLGDLIEIVERTNCRKGCTHATPLEGGTWFDCDLGILSDMVSKEGQPIPDLEVHGNRYVVCLRRQPPPEPELLVGRTGPDLFDIYPEETP